LIRTAQQTISTRQTLLNQVTQLAQNSLRSQLDVSFAAVNMSEAKLLLIRAQNTLQEAYAELARAMGIEKIIEYQVQEEVVPPSPPTSPADLVAQAVANRPELASVRLSRDAAYNLPRLRRT